MALRRSLRGARGEEEGDSEPAGRPPAEEGVASGSDDDPAALLRRTLDSVADQVDSVFDEAEREAERLRAEAGAEATRLRSEAEADAARIRAEAEAAAERQLADRRAEADRLLGTRVTELEAAITAFAQAGDRLRDRLDGMSEAADAIRRALTELSPAGPRATAEPANRRRTPNGPIAYAYGSGAGDSRDVGPLARAARMAAHGDAPPEIRDALRAEYGPGEADRVLAQLFPDRAAEPAADGESAVPEEALLRAAQMAIAGRDRAEIEGALSREFGLRSPSAIVDDLLG